jgi:type II secretory pathway component GspD/PulD (secretin)
MRTTLRNTIVSLSALLALCAASIAVAQDASPPAKPEGAISLTKVIAAVAKRTGKQFMLDPRVDTSVLPLIGQDPMSLDYADLLAMLDINGFTAIAEGGHIQVIPLANVRQQPLPLISAKESQPEAQYVDRVIAVKNVPAAYLVPLLRPLLPQHAHIVAFPCTNTLLIADTFANVRRIEKLVQAMDTGEPHVPRKCPWPEESAKAGS